MRKVDLVFEYRAQWCSGGQEKERVFPYLHLHNISSWKAATRELERQIFSSHETVFEWFHVTVIDGSSSAWGPYSILDPEDKAIYHWSFTNFGGGVEFKMPSILAERFGWTE